jgi:hypothetical protein
VEAVDMKPGKGAAIVRFSVRLLNEAQEPLLEGHHTYLIRSRRTIEAPSAHRSSET